MNVSFGRIWAIYRKDLRDATRDTRVLVAVLLPLGLGLLYNVMFAKTPTTPTVTIVYTAQSASTLPNRIKTTIGSEARVNLVSVPTETDVRQRLAMKKADVGLIIPNEFDAAVARGESPSLGVLRAQSSTVGGAIVLATLDGVLRPMAGQKSPAVMRVETVPASQVGIETVMERLGIQRYFVFASLMMLVGMITMLALPIVLGEEREKKTLDALVIVASYPEVIMAKALFGLTNILISVLLLLSLTRVTPASIPTFVAAVGLLSVALSGFGLLLGSVLTANQMNTWGSLFLLPIILPPFLIGVAVPGALQVVFNALPSTHAMRLMLNSATTHPFYSQSWLSYVVIALWGVAAFALLRWRLARRSE